MALVLADRVRDTTTTTGTGTVTLSGTAPTGYQNFSVIGNGNTTYYTINAGSQWEVGIGTYSSTGPTLARNTVLESSNANALVNFSAGTKDVFVTYPSDEAVYQDGATIAAGTAVLGVTNGGTGVTTSTGTGNVVLSASPTFTNTVNAANITATGTVNISGGALNSSGAATVGLAATGTITIGAISSANAITLGRSTVSQTTNIQAGATISGSTKTINLGTGGLAGSTTTITIGSTAGTSTTTLNGAVSFAGTIAAPLGSAAAPSYTFTGDTNTGMFSPGADTIAFSEGGVEAMRIDSSGNVGIGTTTPLARLFAQAPTGAGAAFSYIGNANGAYPSDVFGGSFGYNFSAGGAEVDFWNGWTGATGTQGGFAFRRQTGASSQNLLMTIRGDGNVGIGTSAPLTQLNVPDSILVTNNGGYYGGQAYFASGSWRNAVTGQGGYAIRNTSGVFTVYTGASTSAAGTAFTDFAERMRIASDGATTLSVGGVSSTHSFLYNESGGEIQLVDSTGAGPILLDNSGGLARFYKVGTGAMSIGTTGANYIQYVTNSAERMRITSGGDVGIGTSAPTQRLHVRQDQDGTTAALIQNRNATGSPASALQFISGAFDLSDNRYAMISSAGGSSNTLQFWTGSGAAPAERMRIDSSGNVGVGTSAPGYKLEAVTNTTANVGFRVQNQSTTQFAGSGILCSGPSAAGTQGGVAFYYYNTNVGGTTGAASIAQFSFDGVFQRQLASYDLNSQFWNFSTNGSERMRITSAGNVGIGTSAPPQLLAVGNATDQFGAGISGAVTTAYFGSPSSGSGGIRRLAYDRATGNFDFIGGSVASPSTQMTVTSAGNVGIGTTAPAQKLDIRGGDLQVSRGAAGVAADAAINFGSNANNYIFSGNANNIMAFATNGSERARINSSGEFLTGTTTGGRAVCMFASDMWLRLSNASRSYLIGPSIGSNFNIFDETGGYTAFSIDTSANINARNSMFLGAGQNLDNKIEIGSGRTGSNYAYIDLIGDTTYTDFGLRMIRGNTGANTTSEINHRGTGDFILNAVDAASLRFLTSGTERMRFDSAGTSTFTGLLVGRSSASTDVNTANDTGSFSVRGSSTTIASMSFHRTGAFAINMGLGTDNVFRIGGWSASSNAFQMDSGGNLTMLGNVTAYSDARIKKDVETIDSALDLVSKMRGVRYTRIDTKKRGVGVIAQEMLEVCPEVVQQGVGDDDTLSVAYGNLVGVLIEAVKELTARVAELEGK